MKTPKIYLYIISTLFILCVFFLNWNSGEYFGLTWENLIQDNNSEITTMYDSWYNEISGLNSTSWEAIDSWSSLSTSWESTLTSWVNTDEFSNDNTHIIINSWDTISSWEEQIISWEILSWEEQIIELSRIEESTRSDNWNNWNNWNNTRTWTISLIDAITQWLITSSNWTLIAESFFLSQSIVISSSWALIETLPETTISSFNNTVFDISTLALSSPITIIGNENKEDEFSGTYVDPIIINTSTWMQLDFWVDNNHLIFNKRISIEIDSIATDWTLVDILADHGQWRVDEWISTDPNSECLSWWIASIPWTITQIQWWKIKFYICWASTFSLTYLWWANFANFADASIAPGYVDKTVTFITGTHFTTGSVISDVDIRIRRRPIDTQNPWSFGTTNCYPGEKYFTLTHPDGTVVNLINAGQLSAPNPNCPETTTTFDQSGATVITNNYSSWTYRPVGNLSLFNGKSPFGGWVLRMGDTASADWVILYEYTITIKTTDPWFLCIYSPVSLLTGIVVRSTNQIVDQQFDYFQVDDQKWLNSGYYTTLQLSNLNQVWWSWIIANTNIQWRADPLVLLWGIPNPLVQLGWARWTYVNANATSTFIFRNPGANTWASSRYWSRLRLRVNVPAYANVGTYDGTITYTLYEN